MTRGVDQVELVALPHHAHGLRLDRDPALALEVHRIEELVAHLAARHRLGELEDAVGERRLAVVDVRDDREVADLAQVHGCARRYRSCDPTESRGLSSRTPSSRQVATYAARPTARAARSATIWAPIDRPSSESSPAHASCEITASAPEPTRTSAVERIVSVS